MALASNDSARQCKLISTDCDKSRRTCCDVQHSLVKLEVPYQEFFQARSEFIPVSDSTQPPCCFGISLSIKTRVAFPISPEARWRWLLENHDDLYHLKRTA
jgi:hypothetical protein